MNELTPEEQAIIKLSDDDNQRIIKAFVMGESFSLDFVRSLNLEESKRECLDYNQSIKHLKFYQQQAESFKNYVETMKSWY